VHILIAGGSGFLGSYLADHLAENGIDVTLLTRKPKKQQAKNHIKIVYWDGKVLRLPPIDKAIDAVINLCGESIAQWWTPSAKKNIRDSRIIPSKTLVNWCRTTEKKPKTFIQISGIDFYQLDSEQCTESDACGDTFLAKLSKDWEETTNPLQNTPTRLIIARLAPVLAKTHPPLLPLLLATRCFLGSIAGSGEQYFSWIHHQDFTTIMQRMLQDSQYQGIYNVCAPHPIPYKTFMETLADVCKRPLWLKIPDWILKKLLGDMSSLILDSRNVLPHKLLAQDYAFQYPEIHQALTQITEKK